MIIENDGVKHWLELNPTSLRFDGHINAYEL